MLRRLPSFLAVIFVMMLPAPAWAAETIDWSDTPPESGTLMDGEVEISGSGTYPLVVLHAPEVVADYYEVSGTVRYRGVDGDAYTDYCHLTPLGNRILAEAVAPRALSLLHERMASQQPASAAARVGLGS